MAGGVACNKYIKKRLTTMCNKKGLKFFWPSPKYCTDNAAMIAFVGSYKYKKNELSDFNFDIFE